MEGARGGSVVTPLSAAASSNEPFARLDELASFAERSVTTSPEATSGGFSSSVTTTGTTTTSPTLSVIVEVAPFPLGTFFLLAFLLPGTWPGIVAAQPGLESEFWVVPSVAPASEPLLESPEAYIDLNCPTRAAEELVTERKFAAPADGDVLVICQARHMTDQMRPYEQLPCIWRTNPVRGFPPGAKWFGIKKRRFSPTE